MSMLDNSMLQMMPSMRMLDNPMFSDDASHEYAR